MHFLKFYGFIFSRWGSGVRGRLVLLTLQLMFGKTLVAKARMGAASWTWTGTGSPPQMTSTSRSMARHSARSGSMIKRCSSQPLQLIFLLSVEGKNLIQYFFLKIILIF